MALTWPRYQRTYPRSLDFSSEMKPMATFEMVAGLMLAALYLDPWAMAVFLAAVGGIVVLLGSSAFFIRRAWTRGIR